MSESKNLPIVATQPNGAFDKPGDAKRLEYQWHRRVAQRYGELQAEPEFRRGVMRFVYGVLRGERNGFVTAPGQSLAAAIMDRYAIAYCGHIGKLAVDQTQLSDLRGETMVSAFTKLRPHVYWEEDGQPASPVTREGIWTDMGRKWERNVGLGITVATLAAAGAVRYGQATNAPFYTQGRTADVVRRSHGLWNALAVLHDEDENTTLRTLVGATGDARRRLGCYVAAVVDGDVYIPSHFYTTVGEPPYETIEFQGLPRLDSIHETPPLGCPLRMRDTTRDSGSNSRLANMILASSWELTVDVYMAVHEHARENAQT